MATLLGTWELGLRYGHVANLAPIARELARRGHRMPVAVKDVGVARGAPDAPFTAVLQAPLYRKAASQRPTITYGQVIGDGGLNDPSSAVALVEDWLALFDRVQPDAVLGEHAPVSMLAAYVAGLPYAFAGSGFMVPPPQRPLPSLLPWERHGVEARRAADAEADAAIEAVCRAFGVAQPGGLVGLIEHGRRYVMSWPELDVYGVRPDVTYYGPMGGLRASARADWPDGTGPRVFVYLPFGHARASAVIVALTELGWPTVWHSQTPPPDPLPRNLHFAPAPLDMAATLTEARAYIGRVGHASSCDAAAAGCPQLLLPDTLETLLLALRAVHHGLGALRPDDPAPAALRNALERMIDDPAVAEGTAAARRRYARYAPGQAAAELLRDLFCELLPGS